MKTRFMSTRLRGGLPALVGAGALVLSGCQFEGAYDLPLPGSPVDEDDAYQVTAEFDDVLNVVPRSVVMVDDVTVGEVTEVDRIGWHAKVTMNVRNGMIRDYEVKIDATRRATRARIAVPISEQRIVILTYVPVSRIDVPEEARAKLAAARPGGGRAQK